MFLSMIYELVPATQEPSEFPIRVGPLFKLIATSQAL